MITSIDRKSNDYAQHKAVENWKVTCFHHSIMILSDILGLPIIYLFPDAQEKPAVPLCNAAIIARVIVLRSKLA